MAANGSSRRSFTRVSATIPTVLVTAAVMKLAGAEKHIAFSSPLGFLALERNGTQQTFEPLNLQAALCTHLVYSDQGGNLQGNAFGIVRWGDRWCLPAVRLLMELFQSGPPALGGCVFVRPITAFCPDDPRISNPNSPLTIDVHGHVFNGSDIQIERYISLVRARQTPALKDLGEILQEVGWAVAPSGAQEISVLRQINQRLSAGCGPAEFERLHIAQ